MITPFISSSVKVTINSETSAFVSLIISSKVLDIISIEAKSFDEIISVIKMDTAELMITLTELEIKGLILQENSKYYKCK